MFERLYFDEVTVQYLVKKYNEPLVRKKIYIYFKPRKIL